MNLGIRHPETNGHSTAFWSLFFKSFSGFAISTGQTVVNTKQTHKAIYSESLRELTFAAPPFAWN